MPATRNSFAGSAPISAPDSRSLGAMPPPDPPHSARAVATRRGGRNIAGRRPATPEESVSGGTSAPGASLRTDTGGMPERGAGTPPEPTPSRRCPPPAGRPSAALSGPASRLAGHTGPPKPMRTRPSSTRRPTLPGARRPGPGIQPVARAHAAARRGSVSLLSWYQASGSVRRRRTISGMTSRSLCRGSHPSCCRAREMSSS